MSEDGTVVTAVDSEIGVPKCRAPCAEDPDHREGRMAAVAMLRTLRTAPGVHGLLHSTVREVLARGRPEVLRGLLAEIQTALEAAGATT